jgi:dephospho-CoA kinase
MRTVIGLTGGIGSGKTTVANLFAQYGVTLVDADVLSRKVVEPNTIGWHAIVQRWGQRVLLSDQNLNRQAIRANIFSHPEEKIWLENTLHPLIRDAARQALAASKSPYALWIVPLMIEAKWNDLCDRLLVIDVPESLQITRTCARDNNTPAQIERILESQASRTERNQQADDILLNDGNISSLKVAVAQLHQNYLILASQRAETQS